MTETAKALQVEIPGGQPLVFDHLLLDFTGTLSTDGRLIPGLYERLRVFAHMLEVTVVTADTFGTVERELHDLPLNIKTVQTGRDKAVFIAKLGADRVVVIGNGRNDVPMAERAGLSIAVIGEEGASGELLRIADVVVGDIYTALDLLANPTRLVATLRR